MEREGSRQGGSQLWKRKVRRGRGCVSMVLANTKVPGLPISHLHPLSPPQINTLVVSIPGCLGICLCQWASPCALRARHIHIQPSHAHPRLRAHCCLASPLLWGRLAEAPHCPRTSDTYPGSLVAGAEQLGHKQCLVLWKALGEVDFFILPAPT